jgi:hypothetical protein
LIAVGLLRHVFALFEGLYHGLVNHVAIGFVCVAHIRLFAEDSPGEEVTIGAVAPEHRYVIG